MPSSCLSAEQKIVADVANEDNDKRIEETTKIQAKNSSEEKASPAGKWLAVLLTGSPTYYSAFEHHGVVRSGLFSIGLLAVSQCLSVGVSFGRLRVARDTRSEGGRHRSDPVSVGGAKRDER